MVAGMQVHSGAGILTLDGGDFDGDPIKVPHPANVVVEERRTKAANSETLASSTFALRSGPNQADEVPVAPGKAPWRSD
jgi:hypothetical protein